MFNLIKYFFFYLQNPQRFTLVWIAEANNINNILLPIITGVVALVALVNFCNIFSKSSQRKKSIFEHLRYLLVVIFGLSFWLMGFPYYPIAFLQGNKINILNVITFSFTLSSFLMFSLFAWMICLFVIFIIITSVLESISPRLSASVLKIDRGFDNSLSFQGYLGKAFLIILGLIGVGGSFFLIRKFLISVGTFYDFSWLFCLFLTVLYTVISLIINLICLLVRLFSNDNKQVS